jgi:galactokinase
MPPEQVTAFAPGRVNLIGEHTDYNEGLALAFSIATGVTVRATAADDGQIRAAALDLGEDDAFAAGAAPAAVPGWRAFLRGMVAELGAVGVEVPAAGIEIAGTVPRGAGLSSSAALEVALGLALLERAEAPRPADWELARICSRVENVWVGARTGLLDQVTSLRGKAGTALRIDFQSEQITPVRLALGQWRLVTLDSGDRHANAESGYNERRAECAQACERLGIASLRDADLEMVQRLPMPLSARARHIVEENDRVDAAVAALAADDLPALGRLLDASHASQRDLFAVSTPAVEAAVAALHDAGAAGARIMGGGFGGHVLALIPPDGDVPPGAHAVLAGPGAHVLAAS